MTTVQTPLVVVRDVRTCDRHPQHEITLITDGLRSYAYGDDFDASTAARKGVNITVVCQQPAGDVALLTCDGIVSFRMDVDAWTADVQTIELLVEHGQPVDVED